MGVSQFLPFGTGGSANALTFNAYNALTTLRANGFQPGVAKSEEANTVWRQATTGAAALAKFAADFGLADVLDNGDHAAFALQIRDAINQLINTRKIWRAGDAKVSFASVVEDGWLEMNGQIVSRTTYAALFAEVGTIWGGGDGSTTFKIGDARGRFLRVWDLAGVLDGDGPRGLGTFQNDMIRAHTHGVLADDGGFNTNSNNVVSGTDRATLYTAQTTPTGGAETRATNIAVRLLIKT